MKSSLMYNDWPLLLRVAVDWFINRRNRWSTMTFLSIGRLYVWVCIRLQIGIPISLRRVLHSNILTTVIVNILNSSINILSIIISNILLNFQLSLSLPLPFLSQHTTTNNSNKNNNKSKHTSNGSTNYSIFRYYISTLIISIIIVVTCCIRFTVYWVKIIRAETILVTAFIFTVVI